MLGSCWSETHSSIRRLFQSVQRLISDCKVKTQLYQFLQKELQGVVGKEGENKSHLKVFILYGPEYRQIFFQLWNGLRQGVLKEYESRIRERESNWRWEILMGHASAVLPISEELPWPKLVNGIIPGNTCIWWWSPSPLPYSTSFTVCSCRTGCRCYWHHPNF